MTKRQTTDAFLATVSQSTRAANARQGAAVPILAGSGALPASLAGQGPKGSQTGKDCRCRESDLQRDCEAWLRFRGIEYLHLSPMAREKRGWPDLVFAVAGRPVAVELKTARGRVSQAQEECHVRLTTDGWIVRVCRSVQEMRDVVDQLGERE